MRWRTTIALGMLGAAVATPDLAEAQFSPQGLLGGITRPFDRCWATLATIPAVIATARRRPILKQPQACPQMRCRAQKEQGLAGPARRPGQTPRGDSRLYILAG